MLVSAALDAGPLLPDSQCSVLEDDCVSIALSVAAAVTNDHKLSGCKQQKRALSDQQGPRVPREYVCRLLSLQRFWGRLN